MTTMSGQAQKFSVLLRKKKIGKIGKSYTSVSVSVLPLVGWPSQVYGAILIYQCSKCRPLTFADTNTDSKKKK